MSFKREWLSGMQVQSERDLVGGDRQSQKKIKVETVEVREKTKIEEFEASAIHRHSDYAENKRNFGPLAATDKERLDRTQKDRRFKINPLLRNPLSIEQEEQRIIEERVRTRIDAISAAALAQAATDGYGQGLKQGRDEALKKFRDEGSKRLAQFESLLAELEQCKERIVRNNEHFVMSLIFEIAQAVVLRELKADREYISRLAKQIIEQSGVRENIRIKISKNDLESIGILKEELAKSLGQLKNVQIEPTDQVQLGGCIVETEHNVVNATVETQLENFKSALLGEENATKATGTDS